MHRFGLGSRGLVPEGIETKTVDILCLCLP